MKNFRFLLPLFLFLLIPAIHHAQSNTPATRVDTITAGYYYQPDSNFISFNVVIMSGGKSTEYNVQGNHLPPTVARLIETQPAGTKIIYESITVNENGVLKKRPSVVYVIGTHNTRPGASSTSKRN